MARVKCRKAVDGACGGILEYDMSYVPQLVTRRFPPCFWSGGDGIFTIYLRQHLQQVWSLGDMSLPYVFTRGGPFFLRIPYGAI